MKILYFDCFAGFDLEKLLGAFVDLGVNSALIEKELKGVDAECTIDVINVTRKGIDAKLAVINAPQKNINFDGIDGILENISNNTLKNRITRVLDVVWNNMGNAYTLEYRDFLYLIAVLTAEFYLDTKKLIVSPVAAANQSDAHKILKNANIEVFFAENSVCTANAFGSAYLSAFASEVCAFCDYDIIKTGYGAGAADAPISNVLRVVLADDGNEYETLELFLKEFMA